MILLDTHVWIWWVHEDKRLPKRHANFIESHRSDGVGVSVVSCWEVAKLVERRKIELPKPIEDWVQDALNYPGVQLVELTPAIAIEATQLPQPFHRDPADQLLVATARFHKFEFVTLDGKILEYPHVSLARI